MRRCHMCAYTHVSVYGVVYKTMCFEARYKCNVSMHGTTNSPRLVDRRESPRQYNIHTK